MARLVRPSGAPEGQNDGSPGPGRRGRRPGQSAAQPNLFSSFRLGALVARQTGRKKREDRFGSATQGGARASLALGYSHIVPPGQPKIAHCVQRWVGRSQNHRSPGGAKEHLGSQTQVLSTTTEATPREGTRLAPPCRPGPPTRRSGLMRSCLSSLTGLGSRVCRDPPLKRVGYSLSPCRAGLCSGARSRQSRVLASRRYRAPSA
jgi:hypothetical protein